MLRRYPIPHPLHPRNLLRRFILALSVRYSARRTLSLLASRLHIPQQEVNALVRSVGGLDGLEGVTLQALEEVGVCGSAAQKLFYFAQWDKLHRHLELYDALPEDAELGTLLASLAHIHERHFRHLYISASLIASYRTHLRYVEHY